MTKKINCPRCGTQVTFEGEPYCPHCGWRREKVEEQLRESAKIDLKVLAFLLVGCIAFAFIYLPFGILAFLVVGSVHLLTVVWARSHLRKLRAGVVPSLAHMPPATRPGDFGAPPSGNRTVRLRRKTKELLGAAVFIALFALVMFALGAATPGGRLLLVIASLVILVATWLAVRSAKRHRHLTAEGAVGSVYVKRQWIAGTGKRRRHMIEYEFFDSAGRLVQAQTTDWSGTLYEEMSVPVFYNPQNPNDHLLAPFSYYEVIQPA